MPVLPSSVDASCDRFKRNAEAMQALLDDLRARITTASLGGTEKSRERHTARGKLLPGDDIGMVLHLG